MTAQIRSLWDTRTPRERAAIIMLSMVFGFAMYWWLLQSADRARFRLRAAVTVLSAQAARLEQQAVELNRLRAAPSAPVSQTDLRVLVQTQVDASGLSRALVRIDAPGANQVQVLFGAVAFTDWLKWAAGLQSQKIRLEACRIEAMSAPGMVSVTATFTRAYP